MFFSAVSYAVYLMGSGQLVQRLGSMRLVGLASCAACLMALLQWWVVYRATGGQQGAVAQLPWQAWLLSMLNATLCTVLPVWLASPAYDAVTAGSESPYTNVSLDAVIVNGALVTVSVPPPCCSSSNCTRVVGSAE